MTIFEPPEAYRILLDTGLWCKYVNTKIANAPSSNRSVFNLDPNEKQLRSLLGGKGVEGVPYEAEYGGENGE